MVKFLKKNKYFIIFFIVVLGLFTYCALNTFAASDDLPYSLFYRTNVRITNLRQIFLNQRSDYLTINGRFLIHSMVQFLLMYGKKLFAILNAIVIAITIFLVKQLSSQKTKTNCQSIYFYLYILGLFLLLGNYKYMIYWVAGAVNYVWLFMLLLGFTFYYFKVGLTRFKILNSFLIFLLCSLHECAFVFLLFFLLADLLKEILENGKKIKISRIILSIIYIALAIGGSLIVLRAPGNLLRMDTAKSWYDMSFLMRLSKSIPVVSLNAFKLFSLDNLIPTIFFITFSIYNFNNKNKMVRLLNICSIIASILCLITNNGWVYFAFAALLCLEVLVINYYNKDNKWSVFTIGIYAAVFSMIITPEYAGARPNYFLDVWMIINICIFTNAFLKNKKVTLIFKVISCLLVLFTSLAEVWIYTNIGQVHRQRLKDIAYVKENNLKYLKLKRIDEKYAKYHAESNCPANKDYWAYNYFLYYYGLASDVVVELEEE